MPSFLKEFARKHLYNPNGTLKPDYRERLRSRGCSEAEINEMEARSVKDVARERQKEEWAVQAERDADEFLAQEQEERRRQGAIASSSPASNYMDEAVELKSTTPQARQAFEMAGLDSEELLNQGFKEPEDFDDATEALLISGEREEKPVYTFTEAEDAAFEEI